MNPDWAGQEATAFPDNWTIGMSFYHNVFAREHNQFVDRFPPPGRADARWRLRASRPRQPERVIRYRDVTPDELFEVARLVVAAEIAKIHTIEWTTQLLYDEPLFRGMNSNWSGLFGEKLGVSKALEYVVSKLRQLRGPRTRRPPGTPPGIGPRDLRHREQRAADPDHVNGGVNHFGSPFNFPEEFVTVYRLHALVPDLIEYPGRAPARHDPEQDPGHRDVPGQGHRLHAGARAWPTGRSAWGGSASACWRCRITRGSCRTCRSGGSRARRSASTSPRWTDSRDRERGVPRFNEFRRQYGLRQLTSFDDFIDQRLPSDSPERADQVELVETDCARCTAPMCATAPR